MLNKTPSFSEFFRKYRRARQGVAGLQFTGYSHSFFPNPKTPTGEVCTMAMTSMTRQKVLDQYFMDARHKLIDVAAFLDRVERAEGDADFRLDAFRDAI